MKKSNKIMKNKVPDTIKSFIECCWVLLQKARKEGCTIRDLYDIAVEAGAPKCAPSTFSTVYYDVAKARRVLVETA